MIQTTDFRGSDLPSWLHFDDKKLQVRGTPPTQQETSSRTLEATGGWVPQGKSDPPVVVFMECMLYNAPLLYIVLNIHIYLYIYVYIYMCICIVYIPGV